MACKTNPNPKILKDSKKHGGIKKISVNPYGTQYVYNDNTGYWAEQINKNIKNK